MNQTNRRGRGQTGCQVIWASGPIRRPLRSGRPRMRRVPKLLADEAWLPPPLTSGWLPRLGRCDVPLVREDTGHDLLLRGERLG
jgi:hypothetical protein